ncbi:hypothetical protein IKS57_02510 [bacterium]|nr:hypothetical protein [bacterium]
MKKLEVQNINQKDKYKNIQISFHDALIAKQLFHFINKELHSFLVYLILVNIYFVFKTVIVLYKQAINTL